ncbi:hypothetical protein ABPG72_021810 [Tetrahymena utriculariae]
MDKKFLDTYVENNNNSQLLAQSNFQKDSLFDQTCQNMKISESNCLKNLGFQANLNPKVRISNDNHQNQNKKMQKRISNDNFKSKEKNDIDEANYSYNIQQNSFLFDINEQGNIQN